MYVMKRNKIYHLFYRDEQGKLKSISTKCTIKTEANRFAVEYLSNRAKPVSNSDDINYKEFREFYKQYAASRFSESYKQYIKYALGQFNRVVPDNKLLRDVCVRDVHDFISLKLTEAGERLVNGYLRTLQAAFERAREMEYLNRNVFKEVKKLKPVKNPPLFLSKPEFQKIIDAESDAQLKLLYKVAVYTGMRMGEIRYLRWCDINLTKNIIIVRSHEDFTTKSKSSRSIPIHNSLKKELQSLQLGKSNKDCIFVNKSTIYTKDYLSARFKSLVRRCELNDSYHFHTLRHTFASWLVQRGVPIYTVSKLLGHADLSTTQIYAHLKNDDFRNAVERLD